MRYFKTIEDGKLKRLDTCEVEVSGEEISKTEYEMLRAGIETFVKGENVNV